MSSATYPQGMNSYNNRTHMGGYKTWKGSGPFQNPVGITSGNIRPLTNKDPLNSAPAPFGRPRPIKHYRRGISVPLPIDESDSAEYKAQSEYYSHRNSHSSVQDKMVAQLQDQPGRFIIKEHVGNNIIDVDKECHKCDGINIVSSWYPIADLTDKPEPIVTNPLLCCNQQRKAIMRARPRSSIVKKDYYQTVGAYLYNRCQTFKQRQFNFLKKHIILDEEAQNRVNTIVTPEIAAHAKPGSAIAELNLYVAQCNPNSLIDFSVTVRVINGILLNMGLITEDIYSHIESLNITTLQELQEAIASLPLSEDARTAIALALLQILSNPDRYGIAAAPSNPAGCRRVYYKPNNPQFAQQGAVSSSTRILKLNTQTIEKNAADINRTNIELTALGLPDASASQIYKMKPVKCTPIVRNGNKQMCFV